MGTLDPLAAEGGRREAFGFVTLDSIDSISTMMRRLFFADYEYGAQKDPRRYTKVCAYEYAGYRPEVWTAQRAERLVLRRDDDHAGIQVVDTYGVWSISTSLREQPAYGDEALRKGMYLVVSDHHLQAKLRTPEGRLAWWHVELEEPPE